MDLYPAIDLLAGGPVRLHQGRFDEVTRFGDDAVALARAFASGGAAWLHIVDLDGARDGGWRNLDLIASIASAVDISIQAGGGVRAAADIEAALERGVTRVVVGTAAVESPATFAPWARRFGDHVAVSLDTRDGTVATRGWTDDSPASLPSVAKALCDAGARRFIHTNITRDGTLEGVDLSGFRQLQPLGRPVIVAGGIASYADLDSVRDAGAEGAIVGRALLDGTLELRQALRVAT
jgi:phosphoribosylformimino-5-aminoimidazole carboxamide ribotide isomerase